MIFTLNFANISDNSSDYLLKLKNLAHHPLTKSPLRVEKKNEHHIKYLIISTIINLILWPVRFRGMVIELNDNSYCHIWLDKKHI